MPRNPEEVAPPQVEQDQGSNLSGDWKRLRGADTGFQRLAFATLCFAVTFVVVGLLFPGIATFVLLPVLVAGGLWVGVAANTRKDGFVGGLIFGWTGYFLGLLILLPAELALESGIAWIPIGLLAGFVAGVVFGFLTGLVSAVAGYLGARLAGKPGRVLQKGKGGPPIHGPEVGTEDRGTE